MTARELCAARHRNLEPLTLPLDPAVNLITGDNGQGKTNLLEAVWLFSALRSFRAGHPRDLIRFGADDSRLSLSFDSHGRTHTAELRFARAGRRRLLLGGSEEKKTAEYLGLFCAVLFTPEDLELVKAGPDGRRRFLDTALSQLRPKYYQALAGYQRALRQKSALLRGAGPEGAAPAELSVWNERLAAAGAVLIRLRSQYVRGLDARARTYLSAFSGGREQLSLRYVTDAARELPDDPRELAELLLRRLAEKSAVEAQARQCLCGPHRDDIDVLVGGRPARLFASQGQQRSCVLAMKLAEGDLVQETVGEYPVFLFDDVLSELDPLRQEQITRQLDGRQVILTCCRDDGTLPLPAGRRFYVTAGRVETG